MKKDYTQKRTTAQKAVKLVRSGDRVFVGSMSSFAYDLMDALYDRKDELEDVTIICAMSIKPSRMLCTPVGEHNPFHLLTYFQGASERYASRNCGMPVDFTSIHLSQMDLIAKEVVKPDVCFFEVSEPDEAGYCSFGPTGCAVHTYFQEQARNIILEVNKQTPYIIGQHSLISIQEADAYIEVDNEVSSLEPDKLDEVSEKISDIVLDMVPDGATIQLGLGKLSTAIGYGLQKKNDLGIYSELLSEPMMLLMKNGNVTNQNKGYLDGVSAFAFALGTREFYQFIDKNPELYAGTFSFINDPRNVAKNRNMVSINTAMSIDLYGQVAAESMGWKQHSAVGGQIDFVKGAQWSEGGKSIIAMPSTFIKNGERKSKICLSFPKGTAVTTPRSEVQYVATEYGCVNLKLLTMSDRVRAMISLAHPDFREELTDQAKEFGLI